MTVIADVVVIGSGVLGCAAAFALTEAGIRRVIVVDRGPLVSGMTRRNAGLVHTYQADTASIRLAQHGLETFRHWATVIGGSCGYVETGTVVTAEQEADERQLRDRVKTQATLGIQARLHPPTELAPLFPPASFEDVILTALEPASGYVDSVLAAQGLARRARDKGCKFETGSQVRQIGQERGRVTHLATTTGEIQTPLVIIAAGAGAERLLLPLGVTLNLSFCRGVIGFFEQPPALHSEGHPTFIDAADASMLRPHAFHLSAAGVADGNPAPRASDSLDEFVTGPEAERLSALAARRVPQLTGALLKRAHAILYDRLADGLPGVGRVPGLEGLFVIAGFGESAVAVAPGAGRAIAEMIVDGSSQIDLSTLSLDRPGLSEPRPHAD